MRVVILGGSRFGAAIAERLIASSHEVVLIDKDRTRLERLSERMDCGMIEGDGTMPTTLREAFRDKDDVFIAVTNASDDNILASIVARSVGFGRVIPQITSTELMDICHELELDDFINPHESVAESICAGLEDDTAIDKDAALCHELALKRVTVAEGKGGQALSRFEMPEGVLPIAFIRDDVEEFLTADTALTDGDILLFAVKRDSAEALDAVFHP